VQDEGEVQNAGFKAWKRRIGTEHIEDVLGYWQALQGRMNYEALVVMVMGVWFVPVNRKQGKLGDKADRLPQNILDWNVIGVVVIGVEGQDAFREGIHHVFARDVHDRVTDEMLGQGCVFFQQAGKFLVFLPVRQVPEQKEEARLFKAETFVVPEAFDYLFHVYAPVVKLAFARHVVAVFDWMGDNLGDFGQAHEHALPAYVPQPALYVVFQVELVVDHVLFAQKLSVFIYKIIGLPVFHNYILHTNGGLRNPKTKFLFKKYMNNKYPRIFETAAVFGVSAATALLF